MAAGTLAHNHNHRHQHGTPHVPTVAPDRRQLTEDDADYVRLHAGTVKRLEASISQYARELRATGGDAHRMAEASSRFVRRHTAILRSAYELAHREGVRDYFAATSKTAKPPHVAPDLAAERKQMAFYAPSVARMAAEGLRTYQETLRDGKAAVRASLRESGATAAIRLADGRQGLGDWQQSLAPRVALQAEIVWPAMSDGYLQGGAADVARPFSRVWWRLGPVKTQHCDDCPWMAFNSPYGAPGSGDNELWQVPGDGRTQCGAGCKCSLELGWEEMPASGNYDWTDFLPPDMYTRNPSAKLPTSEQGTGGLLPGDVARGPIAVDANGNYVYGGTSAERAYYAQMSPHETPYGALSESLAVLPPPSTLAGLDAGELHALDDFRSAWFHWDAVRGELPPAPTLFGAETAPMLQALTRRRYLVRGQFPSWDALTRAQQEALQEVYDAVLEWNAARSGLDTADVEAGALAGAGVGMSEPRDWVQAVALYDPAHKPKGSPGAGQFDQYGNHGQHVSTGSGRRGRAGQKERGGGGGQEGAGRGRRASTVERVKEPTRADHAKADEMHTAARRARSEPEAEAIRVRFRGRQLDRAERAATEAHGRAVTRVAQARLQVEQMHAQVARELGDQAHARLERRAPKTAERLHAAEEAASRGRTAEDAAQRELTRRYQEAQRVREESQRQGVNVRNHPAYPASRDALAAANRAYVAAAAATARAERQVSSITQRHLTPTEEQIQAHPAYQKAAQALEAARAEQLGIEKQLHGIRTEREALPWRAARAEAALDRAAGGSGYVIRDDGGEGRAALREMFGRDLTREEIGGLVGAQPGDHVQLRGAEGMTLRPNGPRIVGITLHGAGFEPGKSEGAYEAHRQLTYDGKDFGGGLTMHNASFEVSDSGHGLGTRVFARQAQALSRLGVGSILTNAVGQKGDNYNGYYTWARLGYNARVNPREYVPSGTKLLATVAKARTIQGLMKTAEGRDWWREHGGGMGMEFNLKPNSVSMRVLSKYLKYRGISLSERHGSAEEIGWTAEDERAADQAWAEIAAETPDAEDEVQLREPDDAATVRLRNDDHSNHGKFTYTGGPGSQGGRAEGEGEAGHAGGHAQEHTAARPSGGQRKYTGAKLGPAQRAQQERGLAEDRAQLLKVEHALGQHDAFLAGHEATHPDYERISEQRMRLASAHEALQERIKARETLLGMRDEASGPRDNRVAYDRRARAGAREDPAWLRWRSLATSLAHAEAELAGQRPFGQGTGPANAAEAAQRRADLEARVKELRPQVERARAAIKAEREAAPKSPEAHSAAGREMLGLSNRERALMARLSQAIPARERERVEADLAAVRARRAELAPMVREQARAKAREDATAYYARAGAERQRAQRAADPEGVRRQEREKQRLYRARKKAAQQQEQQQQSEQMHELLPWQDAWELMPDPALVRLVENDQTAQ